LFITIRSANHEITPAVQHISIPDKLTQLGVELRMKDVDYIFNNDPSRLAILRIQT
jgi:hypothetical protein